MYRFDPFFAEFRIRRLEPVNLFNLCVQILGRTQTGRGVGSKGSKPHACPHALFITLITDCQQGGGDAVPQRLRIVAARIVRQSLAKYRPLILPAPATARLEGSPVGRPVSTSGTANGVGRPVWHSGNMFGMQVDYCTHTLIYAIACIGCEICLRC